MRRGPINQPNNKGKPWNSKLIERLLLIMTVANPEQFTSKGKPVTYTEAFVEFYNWRNDGQVHEMHGMIKFEKMYALTVKNPHNLGTHWIIQISSILYSAHVVFRNQNKFVFYINNYIDWNKFNQLYDLNLMEKDVRNADAIARKLGLILIRANNHKLEVAKDERRKREEIVERRTTEAMATKCRRNRGGIGLSSKKEENYESDIGDDINPDQADDKYPLHY